MTYYFAGDIGGTNTRIHLYCVPEKGDEQLIAKGQYSSPKFASLTAVINKFYRDENVDVEISTACFSAAGPVTKGSVNLTNLGWCVTERELESELKIGKVTLLNDFEACGYGLELLQPDEIFEISNNRTADRHGNKIIIGAGTGLGEAYILRAGDEVIVVPGEGGHTDFSPRNKAEFELMLFNKRKLDLSRVAVERIVSGPGLENIYWFFVEKNPKHENPDVSSQIRSAEMPGAIISKYGIDNEVSTAPPVSLPPQTSHLIHSSCSSPSSCLHKSAIDVTSANPKDLLCEKALNMFASCYGSEAGNMALNVLPSGGVYISGGIAPKIRDILGGEFLSNFHNKGRMRSYLSNYPVYVVMNPSLGILGARYMARRNLARFNQELGRNLSAGDVRNLSGNIKLLSEERKEYKSDYRRGHEQKKPTPVFERESSRTSHNLGWMGAGLAIAAATLLAFMLGRKGREIN